MKDPSRTSRVVLTHETKNSLVAIKRKKAIALHLTIFDHQVLRASMKKVREHTPRTARLRQQVSKGQKKAARTMKSLRVINLTKIK